METNSTALRELHERSEALFSKRLSWMSFLQDVAENFFPERADFTSTRNLGHDFAGNLDTSYPLLMRRDLGNSFGSMLRPSGKQWFHQTVQHESRLNRDAKAWLEQSTALQYRAMYDINSGFVRSTKEGDHDFAAFGQCVISVEKYARRRRNRQPDPQLLYRCWHLRDVAWMEDIAGRINFVTHRWRPCARDLAKQFEGKVSQQVTDLATREPFTEVECRRIVLSSEMIDGDESKQFDWVSIIYEVATMKVLEREGSRTNIYVIPRWQTVSGSQYAYSPATVAGLPDARLLQAMTGTLLEAGERYVRPPMIAVEEVVRSDVNIFPGGITWVDREYDEKLGEALRPLTQDKGGMPIGIEMQRDARAMLMEAFYLNKLSLPPTDREMTATETMQRVSEYIRQALPLFEPMEASYNGQICEVTFETLMFWDGPELGAFGPIRDIPRQLQGADVKFKFQSPLQAAVDSQKGQLLAQSKALIAQVMDLDPISPVVLNARTALRDALSGIGVPARWTRTEEEVEDAALQADEAMQAKQQMEQQAAGAATAVDVTKALEQAQSVQQRAAA